MFCKTLALGLVQGLFLTSVVSLAFAAENPGLSAAQIVEKNVAARGGLQAWRAVQTLSLEGKMGVGGNQRATLAVPGPPVKPGQKPGHGTAPALPEQVASHRPVEEVQLPFQMELARSHKMRFTLQFNGQTAVQVFDGTQGWKVRPFLNRGDVESFTADELKIASTQSELDGYLIDYATKGTRIERDGMEQVEGRDTYKLKLTLRNGQAFHVWIDAKTFLEAKIEGQPRRLDGAWHPVDVYYRDYRAVNGLQIPFVLETNVLPVGRTALGFKDVPVPVERISIERVAVNPHFDPSAFSRPQLLAAATTAAARPMK
jgi:hypothetical protein